MRNSRHLIGCKESRGGLVYLGTLASSASQSVLTRDTMRTPNRGIMSPAAARASHLHSNLHAEAIRRQPSRGWGKPYERFFLPEIEVPVAGAKLLRSGPMPEEQTLTPSVGDLYLARLRGTIRVADAPAITFMFMLHLARDTPAGMELLSHYWIGAHPEFVRFLGGRDTPALMARWVWTPTPWSGWPTRSPCTT